jgi:peptidoglycan/LPS O-acetylase OafA/YrhL
VPQHDHGASGALLTPTSTSVTGQRPTSSAPPADRMRRDIQGLRAVAVLAVVLFHFWPHGLTGGYVGVDVFFVISGFLITSHLLRTPPTSGRALLSFWARRVRRLLPAATLVLLVTLVATLVWLPQTQLPGVAKELAAAAGYVENWALAASSTDYLAAENAPSPVQHYWSLSVEEQFYLFWPLLLAALYWLGGRVGRRRDRHATEGPPRLLWWALGAVFLGSLGCSVWWTQANPAAAYFVTPTRVWELALGALLALAMSRGWAVQSGAARAALAWLGLAMVVWTTVTFTSSTAFPGYAALLPTVGTALVIAADSDEARFSPRALLGWRPSQFMGDVSYSVYLWHWPVVVIAPYALGHPMGWPAKVAALALVVALSAASKRWVEDGIRTAPALRRSLPKSFAVAAVSIAVVMGSSLTVVHGARADQVAAQKELKSALKHTDCLGAAALREQGCGPVAGPKMIGTPAVARDDKPDVYADDCWSNKPFTRHRICTYGNKAGTTRVALLGNSHAGHWQPVLAPLMQRKGWRMDTYLVSQCYTVTIPIAFKPETTSQNCVAWNKWAIQSIVKGRYDLVIMSDRTFEQLKGVPAKDKSRVAERGYVQTLKAFTDAGVHVLVLRDVPEAVLEAPDCIAQHLADVEACSQPQARAVEPDPLADAARKDRTGLASVLDVTDRFCRDGRCHSVIGGLIAYFDHGHMTKTFVQTLAPDVDPAVEKALGR